MHIALLQCQPQPLALEDNLHRLRQEAFKAQAAGAQLLVTPEMYTSGYNIGLHAVRHLAEPVDGPTARCLAALAREAGIALLYGYPERGPDGRIYNSVQLLDDQGVSLLNYRKTHLFGELDRAMFSPGEQACAVVELHGWSLGVLICYDLEFPENCRRLALAGAQLIVVPTANMEPFEFIADVTVRSRAFENHCYVAYANYCGQEGEIRYCGLSSVASPQGERLVRGTDRESLLHAQLDRSAPGLSQKMNNYLTDRRPELG